MPWSRDSKAHAVVSSSKNRTLLKPNKGTSSPLFGARTLAKRFRRAHVRHQRSTLYSSRYSPNEGVELSDGVRHAKQTSSLRRIDLDQTALNREEDATYVSKTAAFPAMSP